MNEKEIIHSSIELMKLVERIGFMPLLHCGIEGFSAEEMVDEDCGYVALPEGGWDWPLWKWKGEVITEGGHVYGKFFAGKAGFVSREWWPDLVNYRRATCPVPAEGSVEEAILMTLTEHGSMITRELRALCGFTGSKMRSRFDGYVTKLQMGCRVVTEDFVYPHDRHGNEYGWGWSLLTVPEQLYGAEACRCDRTPEQSLEKIINHLKQMCPQATEKQIMKIIR